MRIISTLSFSPLFSISKLLWGLFLLLALLALVALATWQGNDSSITFSSGNETKNWLGFWGASFAELAMQFFGLSSIVPLFILLLWSIFKLQRGRDFSLKYRGIVAIFACIILAGFASSIFVPSGWRLPIGLGGLLGDSFLALFTQVTGLEIAGVSAILISPLLFIIGLFAFLYATNLLFAMKEQHSPVNSSTINYETNSNVDIELSDTEPKDIFSALSNLSGLILHIILWVKSKIISKKTKSGGATSGEQQNRIEPTLARVQIPAPAPVPVAPPLAPPLASPPVRRKKSVAKAVNKTATMPLFSQGKKFILPSLELLTEMPAKIIDNSLTKEVLQQKAEMLERVLDDFGIKGKILQVRPGPVVTLYELEPAPGIKSSRIIGLADDIARSMSAIAARVAVVAGRNAIGIELPNEKRETVYLREQLNSPTFQNFNGKLPMCLGKTIGGEPVVADMARMPHLLVAGTTGSGKSVAINTMILSLLYKHSPEMCKLIMIDPKMLELSIYDGIPHLLTPVVTEPKKAVVALKWCVREMEERYRKMSKLGVRNIEGFNSRIATAQAKGENLSRTVQTGFDKETGEAIFESEELALEHMPFIVVVIDEMADLMMVAGKDIEGTVQRLAQMARAAGIHVIMATQRPSVDVITGTIKANFPTRISFQVTSKIDSRTILGEMGAEQLLGMGDMLYMAGGGRITRVHGPFVSDREVEDVVNHLKMQGVPEYLETITEEDSEDVTSGEAMGGTGDSATSGDLYSQALNIVLKDRKSSISYLQRRLSIGYNKAASFIERMEQEGVVSAPSHSGKREILVPEASENI